VLIVHKVITFSFEYFLYDSGGFSESSENSLDVVTLLHGDNTHVILFINPNKEIFLGIMENTTRIGPVATTA
jgi:hypothetical protein